MPEFRGVSRCEYYMKIVPHKFYIGSSKIDRETFQYSAHYQCREGNGEKEDSHQVTFMHEISAVGIKYSKVSVTTLQMLTSLMAVIGGVYVVMGILYRSLSKII